jgi:hypothetical protein
MTPVFGIFRVRFAKALLALAAAAALAGSLEAAAAQSLRESRAQNDEERQLQNEASYTKGLCGMEFDVAIDWSTFGHWPEGAGVADACGAALSSLEKACRQYKAQRVTRFVCTGDGSGASQNGTVLRYGASPR